MSYGNDPKARWNRRGGLEPSTDWQEFTRRRLLWLYDDYPRSLGQTPQAQADLRAWRMLGQRSAA